MYSLKNRLATTIILALGLGLWACDDSETTNNAKQGANAMVITSDYESGALSVINDDTLEVSPLVRVVPSDSICRYDALTQQMFLVSRSGFDAISVISSDGKWRVLGQYSVEAGSNPQDIAVIDATRALVPRLSSAELLVVHPTAGTVLQRIDISAYADADGLPEAAQALAVNGTVYVTLQRLTPTWTVEGYSSALILDGATGQIVNEVKLTGTNPTGKLRFSVAAGGIVLLETGGYGVADGGIEVMDLAGRVSGWRVTEATLGGDVIDAVIATATKGYAVISVAGATGSNTQLVSFNPATGAKLATLITSAGFDLSYLELNGNDELWVTDRTPTAPGVRVFNVANDGEVSAGPLDVGLPPTMICFGN